MSPSRIPGIPKPQCDLILGLFASSSHEIQLILFGSRAKGNFREGSDIDLAVKSSKVSLEDRDQWLLQYDELNLPWKLDLIVYHLVQEPELRSHIDRVGKIIFP